MTQNTFRSNLVLTTFLVYCYYFLEWLFFFTKPSFLTRLNSLDVISVLFVPGLFILLASLMLIFIVYFVAQFFGKRDIALFVPIAILTLIFFILIDNFTHTVFGFYVGAYSGSSRYGYCALLFLLTIFAYKQVIALISSDLWVRHEKTIALSALSLPMFSILVILMKLLGMDFQKEDPVVVEFAQHPNIILLSTDGVIADHMSVFDYNRDTTPFIKTLAVESLFSENSFTNSANTTGSIGALISGKLPASTGVIFPPSVFTGIDVFEHFAGLFKKNGYRAFDAGTPHFADSYDLNIRDAFDVTTMRKHESGNNILTLPMSFRLHFASESFFLGVVNDRIVSRILHVLFIKDFTDAYKSVIDISWTGLTDNQRLQGLYAFIREGNGSPFFAHLHLMETHGARFRLSAQHFSIGLEQSSDFMTEFYDDAILNFDNKVKELVGFLKHNNIYENTILVLTTDHGTARALNQRLPLIIRFPGTKHKGHITYSTQRADIPPTILDFLGAETPKWMDGNSLISGDHDRKRLIFSVKAAQNQKDKSGQFQIVNYAPPFYALGKLAIIQCQQMIQLNLLTQELQQSLIKKHSNPCSLDELITIDEAYELMVSYLDKEGYDMAGFTRH